MAVSREKIAACDSEEFALTSPDDPRSTCNPQINQYFNFIYKEP